MSTVQLDQTGKRLRWSARGLGSLIGAFWLFMLTGYAIQDFQNAEPLTLEGAVLGSLVGATLVGLGIAWRREEIGGAIMVGGGLALSVFAYVTAGHNKGFAVLISGVPFLIVGLLFLASWRRSKQR